MNLIIGRNTDISYYMFKLHISCEVGYSWASPGSENIDRRWKNRKIDPSSWINRRPSKLGRWENYCYDYCCCCCYKISTKSTFQYLQNIYTWKFIYTLANQQCNSMFLLSNKTSAFTYNEIPNSQNLSSYALCNLCVQIGLKESNLYIYIYGELGDHFLIEDMETIYVL